MLLQFIHALGLEKPKNGTRKDFGIFKRFLAAIWERLLATAVWLWTTSNWTHVLICLQPATQKLSLIIMILQRSDCSLPINSLAQIYPPKKQFSCTYKRDLNSLQSNALFISYPLSCISLFSFQIISQAAVALCICLSEASHHSVPSLHSVLFFAGQLLTLLLCTALLCQLWEAACFIAEIKIKGLAALCLL